VGNMNCTTGQNLVGGRAVFPTLYGWVTKELSCCTGDYVMLKCDNLRKVALIVIGGVPTVCEVRFMCWFVACTRILWDGSISTNLRQKVRQLVDLPKVDVGIQHLGFIYLLADILPAGIQFTPPVGGCPMFSSCVVVYLSLLHMFSSQGIGFSLQHFPCLPVSEQILEYWNSMQQVLHIAECCLMARFISSKHIDVSHCLC